MNLSEFKTQLISTIEQIGFDIKALRDWRGSLIKDNAPTADSVWSSRKIDVELSTKVDKVSGKGLSDANFTQSEKSKLSSLESSKYRGQFTSENNLFNDFPEGSEESWHNNKSGFYADVDLGVGHGVVRYVWDSTDFIWVEQVGKSTQLTGSQIKDMYEDQPDTNVFTDDEKLKLSKVVDTAQEIAEADSKSLPIDDDKIGFLDSISGGLVAIKFVQLIDYIKTKIVVTWESLTGNQKSINLMGFEDGDGLDIKFENIVNEYRMGGEALPIVNKVLELPAPPPSTISSNIEGNLKAGDTLGKYSGKFTIPCAGWTWEETLRDIAIDYIPPIFTSFNIESQATTVEVGTTLSGVKSFRWDITTNNGIVPTIDIYDMTTSQTLLGGTPNDGVQEHIIAASHLNTDGQTQSWKAIAKDDIGDDVESSDFTVTSRFYRYYGAVGNLPVSNVDGATNRTYANLLTKDFHKNGSNTFVLETGTAHKVLVVLLPPDKFIVSAKDITNIGINITSNYVHSTITVKDSGGTDREYNMYTMTMDEPYDKNSEHEIKTN